VRVFLSQDVAEAILGGKERDEEKREEDMGGRGVGREEAREEERGEGRRGRKRSEEE